MEASFPPPAGSGRSPTWRWIESIDGLWPATGGCPRSACGIQQRTMEETQNEQKLKESPLQAMAFMQIHVGHVICKILLISPYIRNTYHASPRIFCSKYQDSGTHFSFYSVAPGHALIL